MNLKIPRTVFCSYPFQIFKKDTCESENSWDSFLLIPFSNIKKSILANLKIPETVFLL